MPINTPCFCQVRLWLASCPGRAWLCRFLLPQARNTPDTPKCVHVILMKPWVHLLHLYYYLLFYLLSSWEGSHRVGVASAWSQTTAISCFSLLNAGIKGISHNSSLFFKFTRKHNSKLYFDICSKPTLKSHFKNFWTAYLPGLAGYDYSF